MIIIADKALTRACRRPISCGAVVIKQGKVLACGTAERMVKNFPGHPVTLLPDAVLLPGLVNVHTHIELPPLFEQVRGQDYTAWVMDLLRAKRSLTRRDYDEAAKNNCISVIRSGTTTIADICTHGASLSVLALSGLRAVIFHEIITMAQNGTSLTLPCIQRSSGLLRHGFSPHSPHTVSPYALQKIRRLALQRRLPLCMHIAETKDENLLLQRKSSGLDHLYEAAGWEREWAPRSRSSFAYLDQSGVLGPSFLAVHSVHVDDEDIRIIRRSGAAIAHCPRSNRSLGVGKMPLVKFLRANIPIGLGTDSLASVPSLSLWDEMRYAYSIHRRAGLTAADTLMLATLGGAKALGMETEIGSLEPGKRADCIAVPLPSKDTGDLCSDLLRETKSCIMTMVNGKIIYQADRTER